MAITISSTKRTVFGNKVVLFITGTFASGDTTGDIATGLVAVDFAVGQYTTLAKILSISASAGTLTVATQDPGATGTFTIMVVGH